MNEREERSPPASSNEHEPGIVRRTIGPTFDLDRVAHVSIRSRERTGFSKATCRDVEIAWPDDDELELITRWFRRDDIHLPLGFPRAPSAKHLRHSVLPDLTGGFEPVELLIVRSRSAARPVGFLIVYALRGLGRPHLELDLAVADQGFSGARRIRWIKVAVLGYLFGLRGAESVSWVRRKKVERGRRGGSAYPARGAPIRTSRARFRRLLGRLETRELPVLHYRPPAGKARGAQRGEGS